MENNNYVNVGNIIEQERLKRQAQIAKGVSSDVYDHIEKAHQDDLSKGVEMTDNLSRFANDVDNLNKAETEFLLSKLQRQIVADPDSRLLKSFKSIAINHLNNLEKAHQDGEMHPNGKWVWVASANGGKGDWRTANGRAHKKHQETHGNKDGEGEKKTIDDYASGASTDALKHANADENAKTEVREAAKKELGKRVNNKQVKFSNKEKKELDQLQDEIDRMGFESRLSPDKERRYNELKKKQFVAHVDSLNPEVVGKEQAHKNFIDYIEGTKQKKNDKASSSTDAG